MARLRPILVLQGRVPGPRAHSITTMRTADALIAAGHDPEVWVPRRTGRTENEPGGLDEVRWWYGLRHEVPTNQLACLDGVDLLPRCVQPLTARVLAFTFAGSLVRAARRVAPERAIVVRDAFSIRALAAAKVPFVAEVHELPRRMRPRRATLRALERACGIVTLTETARTFLHTHGGLLDTPSLVLPCGCPDAYVAREPSSVGAREHTPTVTYAGSLQGWKGTERIAALARHFTNVAFCVLGGLPADRRRFARTLPANVTLQGFLAPGKVDDLLAASDVCLVTLDPADERARVFTSPLKLVEAMALGRAILAPNLPPIRELVTHGETGWLHEPSDERSAREGLAHLLADGHMRARLGNAAREHARAFTYGERARRLAAFLEEVWTCTG